MHLHQPSLRHSEKIPSHTEVQVRDDVFVNPIREVFTPLGAPDQPVFLRIPACDEDRTEGLPSIPEQVT